MKKECRLSELKPGQTAIIKEILVEEEIKRRLLDLGLTRNTQVECVANGPSGEPKAYRIRGAVVALRREQGNAILVECETNSRIVALAGNPNVGKSTIFNALTGLKQHTGNWPGKTVANAWGSVRTRGQSYELVDLPGMYSLAVRSEEEAVAREFLSTGQADAVVVVCDATCLERNLILALQILEVEKNVILCVNLMDEAQRKGIRIDLERLAKELSVPVVGTSAHEKRSLEQLVHVLGEKLEETNQLGLQELDGHWKDVPGVAEEMKSQESQAEEMQTEVYIKQSEEICKSVVRYEKQNYNAFDRRMDRWLTSRLLGYPAMMLLLALVFWITIAGANVPSQLLSSFFTEIQDWLTSSFRSIGAPDWLEGLLVQGLFRVMAFVLSVMLPPMAIFFPLFTLLEDMGFLPRFAFNLDHCFKRCKACGKQALTMCMGFGCNAVGVTGCRIMDSPRERLIAVLTNNFVPCNGRFPTLILLLTMFFAGGATGIWGSVKTAFLLTIFILLGIFMTFMVSRFLSATILKGTPSGFTLELPPYRRPRVGQIIVRSLLDRTLFVLGRAASVAAPAGIFLWILANMHVGGMSFLQLGAAWLDPFACLLGLDGVILLAFILGIPANEIVLPIMLMTYLQQGQLMELPALPQLQALLLSRGWTMKTAVCVMLFSLMHWPCATTLLTIKKETGSVKYMILAAVLPTTVGMVVCAVVNGVFGLFL